MYAIFPIDSISRSLLRFLPCSVFLQSCLIFLRGMLPIFSAVSHFFPECFLISFFPFLPVFSHQFSPVDVPHVIYPPFIFPGTVYLPYSCPHFNCPYCTYPVSDLFTHNLYCIYSVYIPIDMCISTAYIYIYTIYIYHNIRIYNFDLIIGYICISTPGTLSSPIHHVCG